MSTLNIQVTTWDKMTYELFDGESDQYKRQEFIIRNSGYIYRNNLDNESYFAEELKLQSDVYRILLNISFQYDQFIINCKNEDLWYHLQGKPYTNSQMGFPDVLEFVQLKQNDIMKIGKKTLKVISIGGKQLQFGIPHYENFGSTIEGNFDSALGECSLVAEDRSQCRICLRTSYSNENPLVSVCRCSGTAKYIHYGCLKTWLEQKMQLKMTPPYTIEYKIGKSVRCEICLSFYPPILRLNNRTYRLYDLGELYLENYVIFEDQDGQILIVNFNNVQSLTVGRGHESNIKISEITISRTHVKLFLNDEKLYIQDQQSKFGTLLKVQQPIKVKENQTLYLQNGRSRIIIKHQQRRQQYYNWFCYGYE